MSAGLAVLAGVFLGVISARAASAMRQDLVWIAFGATAGVMLILGLFACQTSVDFSGAGPYLSMAFLVLIMFALLGGVYQFATIALLWIAIIVFLMAMYVVYGKRLSLPASPR
jgi:FtsH-binding integral membrane protein